MAGRIPLARRNLFQDRRRAVLAIGGVAASLVLVLVLDGVFAGAMQQVNAYLRSSPAATCSRTGDAPSSPSAASPPPSSSSSSSTACSPVPCSR